MIVDGSYLSELWPRRGTRCEITDQAISKPSEDFRKSSNSALASLAFGRIIELSANPFFRREAIRIAK